MARTEGVRTGVSGQRLLTAVGLFTLGGTAFLLSGLLSRWPEVVERLFARGWAATVVPPFSRLTGLAPVPVAEILAAGYVGLRIWTVTRGGWRIAKGRTGAGATLFSGLVVGVRDVGVALVLFYALWGFHYSGPSVASRLGLPPVDEVADAELLRLSDELASVGNASYRRIHGTGDAGRPTEMPDRWDDLGAALEDGWLRVGSRLSLGPLATARYGPPKRLISSAALAYLGLTGVYSPFTAEPMVVGTTPAVALGLTLAHEQAHQRGVTHEGEATFLGYLVAVESRSPRLRYSAAVRARSRILSVLARRDTARARQEMEAWLPGVRRDLDDLLEYRLRHRGPTSRIATRVNDAYLRANRVPGGVQSYDQATRLLLRYARQRGGSVLPGGARDTVD